MTEPTTTHQWETHTESTDPFTAWQQCLHCSAAARNRDEQRDHDRRGCPAQRAVTRG
jgi:hypothetical protein